MKLMQEPHGRVGPAPPKGRAALSSVITHLPPPSPPSHRLLFAVGCEEAKQPRLRPGSAALAPTLRSTSTTPGPRRPPLKGTAEPSCSVRTAPPAQRGPGPTHPGDSGPGAGCPVRGCCPKGPGNPRSPRATAFLPLNHIQVTPALLPLVPSQDRTD